MNKVMDKILSLVFEVCGLLTILCVLVITGYLLIAGTPAITKIGISEFLLGKQWASTGASPSFGIFSFIMTSIYGTVGAMLLGVPVGILTAIYLTKFASKIVKRTVGFVVALLASIPSVVYGLVGMILLVPAVRRIFHLSDGASLFAAIIVLSIMILPSIINVSITALDAVPKSYELGALALGATETETYFKISVPAAKSGILAAIILGEGRAIGEAMAVMMVSGNVANMPSLFSSVRFLTAAIASEMSYASGLQKQALFSIALVLFFFILILNLFLHKITERGNNHELFKITQAKGTNKKGSA